VEEHYSSEKTFIRKIDPLEWQEKLELLADARKGKMSEPKPSGPEFSVIYIRCYIEDEKKGRYDEIGLRIKGSADTENMSPSAIKLADWLLDLYIDVYHIPRVPSYPKRVG
jgi:hypothetical protein